VFCATGSVRVLGGFPFPTLTVYVAGAGSVSAGQTISGLSFAKHGM